MKYGMIAEGSNVNDAIYRCFELIPEESVLKFLRWFRQQPHGESQVMHTLRELVIGAYLASKNFSVRAEPNISGKTPDWLVGQEAIVEVSTLHLPQKLQADIDQQIQAKGTAGYWVPSNTKRLYDKIRDKAEGYRKIIGERSYVVGVFAEFEIELEPDEIHDCLFGAFALFAAYPHLSGVVIFCERSGVYPVQVLQQPIGNQTFYASRWVN